MHMGKSCLEHFVMLAQTHGDKYQGFLSPPVAFSFHIGENHLTLVLALARSGLEI